MRRDGARWAAYFKVAFATTVWGAAYPFTKQLVGEVSPLTVITLRALIGTFLLAVLVRPRVSRADLSAGNLWKLAVLSFLGVSSQQGLQAWALKYTSAGNAGWLIASVPIVVAGMMAFAGERIGPSKITAFLLGSAGTLLVVFSRSGAGAFAAPSTKGDLIFMASCFGWGFYVMCAKLWLTSWRQAKVTALTMAMALATLLPAWLLSGGPAELAGVSARGWVSFAYLGVLSSALGYMFWNDSVETIGAVRASYFIYTEPFATLLAAWLWLGEAASPAAFAGGVLILLGVYFVNRAPAAAAPSGPAGGA